MTVSQRVPSPTYEPPAVAPDEAPAHSPRYAWYVVGVLTLAYVSSFIDRQILALLVAPIRRDLGISDTGMSLLMGLSFALFYTFLGIPIGRLADSRSRRAIICWGIAVWSAMTAACGVVRSYPQLLLARVGVGVGEAALSPPAYSLIADYFPKERLATALSVYSMGIYIGSGLAVVIGGLALSAVPAAGTWTLPVVGAVRPWQSVFLVVAAPGLLIALLALTIREPARRGVVGAPSVPLAEAARYLRANLRTFACHDVGIACVALVNYGIAAWTPTMFARTYGWAPSRTGVVTGLITMAFGVAGIVSGGRLADAMLRAGKRDAKLRACRAGAAGLLASAVLYPLMPTPELALALFVPVSFFAAFPFGAAAAAVQEAAPNQMRAQASAVYLFVVNLLGLGFGPTAVALLTDYAFASDGALRYSLAVVAAAGLVAALALLTAGLAPYRRTMEYRDAWLAERGARG
jgi:MFS family permease